MYNLGNATENLLVSKNEQNKYYDEKIKIDINDSNDSHAIIASLVKEESVCLDIGCGPGYIGELLKEDKKCKVYGIEIDKEAVKLAKKKNCYQEIYSFSITDQNKQSYQQFFNDSVKFDAIIFADILEHVENPGEVIYNFSQKLKKHGKLLISVPNIAHMDISKSLIDREFNYNTTGLLDNTHLRFFTKKSFTQMIDKINEYYNLKLSIKSIHKTIVVPTYASKYINLYNLLNKDNELCALQYIYEIELSDTIVKNAITTTSKNYQKIEKAIKERNELLELTKNQKQEIENLKGELTNIQEQNRLEREILQKEMMEILNSKSWKVTAPLRKIMKIISKKS